MDGKVDIDCAAPLFVQLWYVLMLDKNSPCNWGPLPVFIVPAVVPAAPKPDNDSWWLQSVLQKTKSWRFISEASLSVSPGTKRVPWFCFRGIFYNDRHLGTLHVCTSVGGEDGMMSNILFIVHIWQYGHSLKTVLIDDMYIVEYIASLKSTASSWMEGTF